MSARYRFGPLEQRGVVGPLRAGQVVILALAAALALAAVYLLPGFPGLASALALLGAAGTAVALPLEGRTLEQWAPVAARWALRRGEERHGFRAATPFEGYGADGETDLTLPAPLRGLAMLQVPYGADHVGVLHDRAAGTYTAALSVRAGAFGLCDAAEQERKLAAWGAALAGLARDGSPVRRVQWVERTLPAGGDELAAYLQENRDPALPMTSGLVSSYIELIESAAPASQEHEILIALQVSERLAGREMRRLGGGEQAACELLLRETEGLAERLSLAEITVAGLLRSGEYARTIRDAFDPFGRQARARAALARGETEAAAPMGPLADETCWGHYRSDSAVHRTYWISGWPRTDVGPAFMAPLLMGSSGLRTVSVVIEPVPYSLALRRAEAARTAEVAEEIQRERQGFLTTARIRRRQQATARREEELADGHAEMRAAGFITTHERSVGELDRREPETLHAAQLAQLELQPLYGEQAAGMTFGLPICRGLR